MMWSRETVFDRAIFGYPIRRCPGICEEKGKDCPYPKELSYSYADVSSPNADFSTNGVENPADLGPARNSINPVSEGLSKH